MTSERRPRSFIRHTATYAIGNFARRIVGFAMLPIYTRFLTPAEYGVVGLLTFALALFEPIFGARMGWAIPKFYFDAIDEREKRAVIWGALGLTGAVSAASMCVLIALRGVGSHILFGDNRYALAFGVFVVNLLSQPIEGTGWTYLRLHERSGLFLVFSVVKLAFQVALNLYLVVYLREGVLGVVVSGVVTSVLMSVWLTLYVAVREAPVFDWRISRRMLQFCWPLWLSSLAGLYIGSSGAVYLRMFDTLSDVGRLEVALKFATVVGVFWGPFFQHWEPMSFKYHKEDGGERKFQVAFIAMAAVLFVAGSGISIFAGPVIRLMTTKAFYTAARVVPILALGAILNVLKSFFNFGFFVSGRTKVHTLCQYLTAAVITIGYVLLIPRLGLMGAAVAQCLAFAASFVYVYGFSRRYYDPKINFMPMAGYMLTGVVAYVCADLVLRIANPVLDLIVKSFVLILATGGITFVGLRAIKAVDPLAVESLPWPLNRLGNLQLGRQLES